VTDTQPATDATAKLAADVVLLANHDNALWVLLIERGWPPFEGKWALPGGHVDEGEDAQVAARRELAEEAGLDAVRLHLVGVYGAPGRDPRGRYVSWAYVAVLDQMPDPVAGDDARDARWFRVAEVMADPDRLAFDHHQIITDAVALVGYPFPPMEARPTRMRPPFEAPGYAPHIEQGFGETNDQWKARYHADFVAALTEALAGVELGAYDGTIVDWLAGWGVETVGVLASLFYRCRQAGRLGTDQDREV